MAHHIIKTVGNAEEIRSVNLIHLHPIRNGQMLQIRLHVCIFVWVNLLMESTNMRLFTGTHEEEYECKQNADFDSHCEVENNGQEKRN